MFISTLNKGFICYNMKEHEMNRVVELGKEISGMEPITTSYDGQYIVQYDSSDKVLLYALLDRILNEPEFDLWISSKSL